MQNLAHFRLPLMCVKSYDAPAAATFQSGFSLSTF